MWPVSSLLVAFSQLVIIIVVVERAIMLIDMFDLTDVIDSDSRVSHYMGIDSVI